MNIIDGIDQDEQLKFEDPDWSTYWDDEAQCWMMAEHIYSRCSECHGQGQTLTGHGIWKCDTCDASGRELVNID